MTRRQRMRTTWLRVLQRSAPIAALAMTAWLLPAFAEAVLVDCSKGQKVGPKIKEKAVITVKGTCTENLVITANDVSISTAPNSTATFVPAVPNQATITLDGALRVVIDGVVPGGLTVQGGAFGVSADRGSTLTLKNCVVTGGTRGGVIAAYGSTATVDACDGSGNTGSGVIAANTASLAITNSTVNNNTGNGILAIRGAYVRVGQDREGTTTSKPVTVSGNTGTGVSITEDASGNVV